jgi:prepilin-type processing-associated H-X9-DG protein/prepilin-type N-terminal cleavage/methylation domain-containing protein
MRKPSRAFTLVEVLVVLGVVSILASLTVAGLNAARESGERTREFAAIRTLSQAYATAAADNEGLLVAGFQSGARLQLPDGTEIAGPEAERFPYRLAPYIDWEIHGVYLVNEARNAVRGLDPDSSAYRYAVSLRPAFGLNMYCVGGNVSASGLMCPNDVVTRVSQATRASGLISFVSTGFRASASSPPTAGYFYAQPPRLGPVRWSTDEPTSTSDPRRYGFVDFRHGGRAMVAFLDGHVALMKPDELRDMRLWANKADSATYNLPLR